MARSYKKPYRKDKSRWHQAAAARRIRRLHWSVDIADGMSYRKWYEPWNISDWCFNVDPRLYRYREPEQRDWRIYVLHTGNRRAKRARIRMNEGKRCLNF
jgi:hypothetical protein